MHSRSLVLRVATWVIINIWQKEDSAKFILLTENKH
jgi:hypothetical protein